MGYKIAEAASGRKHNVTLISGPTRLNPPPVKKFISVETTEELSRAVRKEVKKTDCLVMCAAVSDFRIKRPFKKKIKRQKELSLTLVPNKDILKELSRYSYKRVNLLIGFSLETESLVRNAYKKLKAKGLDLIMANQVKKSRNIFGDNKLDVYIIDENRHVVRIRHKNKVFIAHVLLDKIEKLWYLRGKRI